MDRSSLKDKFIGCLLGGAISDAVGYQMQRHPQQWLNFVKGEDLRTFHLEPILPAVLPPAPFTDDTQMALATVEAILKAGKLDGAVVAKEFCKLWQSGEIIDPGYSCTNAVTKLINGESDWRNSGTGEGQAGNGTAMRIAPVGLWLYDKPELLCQEAAAISRITHQDSRSVAGGVAIARAVAWNVNHQELDSEILISELVKAVINYNQELAHLIEKIPYWLDQDEVIAVSEIAASGYEKDFHYNPAHGITGFIIPTVLISLYYFLLCKGDFCQAVSGVLKAGGDIDTTAAITGNLCGSLKGVQDLPEKLINLVKDNEKIRDLAKSLYNLKIREKQIVDSK